MTNALWLDIETTGLNPIQDSILEIGLTATTPCPEFRVIATGNWIFPFVCNPTIHPVVQSMHTDNGLWKECKMMAAQNVAPGLIQARLLEWIDEWDCNNAVMHGSTPSFDRSFLHYHYPEIEKRFHYRSYDISTLIAHARAYFGDSYSKIDREIHRALPDLEDSIANAIHFRNVFLPTGGSR